MDNRSKYAQCLVLLDKGAAWDGEPPLVVAHWAEMEVPPGHTSIPLLVENQAKVLRAEYLAWVHDLGHYRQNGRTVREHLHLDENLSFWWLTSVAEKSPMKSRPIYEIFKLRVLERFYLASGCRGIVLCSPDSRLHRNLSEWCRETGHFYQWKRREASRKLQEPKEFYRRLPQALQALGTLLKRVWIRRRQVSAVNNVPSAGPQATMVTYFPNIDPKLAEQGIFRSRYWEKLHDLLDRGPWLINWIFSYEPNDRYSFSQAVRLRDRMAERARGKANYYFLEEFLTPGALARSLILYLRLYCRGLRLRSIRQQFHFPDSSLNFWPFLAREWQTSLFGSGALDSCLAVAVFKSLAEKLPRQEWAIFSWENQSWERAFTAAWKGSNHGKSIGFQHVSLRFLDLRCFEDPRSYQLVDDPPPLPEVLAVGGVGGLELLKEAGYPQKRMTLVEALRYGYLSQTSVQDRAGGRSGDPASRKKALLVVTGYLADETSSQLLLLAQAAERGGLIGFAEVMVKPHPNCPVEEILAAVAPNLQINVVSDPLTQLWPRAAVVYTANSTSASMEAAMMEVPVLVHVPEDCYNFSPMWGELGVKHVGTVIELCEGLRSLTPAAVKPDYLCLEEGLPRWRSLLKS